MEERVLASNMLAQDVTMGEQLLASNALARDATIEGAGIGKQCAGMRCDNRGEWVLASNALA
jgi:hypothetical protein